MRSDIALRFAAVSRRVPTARLGAGSLGLGGRITFVDLDDVSECAMVEDVVASVLTAARWRGVAGVAEGDLRLW